MYSDMKEGFARLSNIEEPVKDLNVVSDSKQIHLIHQG
jgi:hypothetical protein